MYITRFFLVFLIIFFSMQLFFGEAGIISFIQMKRDTILFFDNVNSLLEINQHLNRQVSLTKENKSYLLMNAHRVGLLADDEFLIKTDVSLVDDSNVYSPGKVILKKEIFHINNLVLFIIALGLSFFIFSIKIFIYYWSLKVSEDAIEEKNMEEKNMVYSLYHSSDEIKNVDTIP